ncbi:MAG: ABC transporter permease [Oscillospiraceae bacterium]|nr:ABC transporter permease [Oscillospiraceae bacterium]
MDKSVTVKKSDGRLGRIVSYVLNHKVSLLVVITIIVVSFFQTMNPNFLREQNILIMLIITSFIGFLGLGVGLLLISGQIDLSTGAVTVMSAVLVALLINAGIPWPLAALITLVFGAVAGAITAFLVNGLGMMSFIATIGMMSVWSGLALVVTRGNPITINDPGFWALSDIRFFDTIPLLFVILLFLVVLYGFMLSQTKFGRSIYIVGGNKNAARLAGINPKRVQNILFINAGAISALCGILFASNFRRGDPVAITLGMDAITAAVLGGISFAGGAGGTGGFLVGLLLLSFFNNGLNISGVGPYWQTFARGAILIAALLLDYLRSRQREKVIRAGTAEKTAAKSK